MILVFYIALIITILILVMLVIAFLICVSRLEIKIKNLDMSNIRKKENNKNIKLQISLRIGKLHWLKLKLNKEKMANIYVKIKKQEEQNKIDMQIIKNKLKKEVKNISENKELKKLILNAKPEIEELKTNIILATERYILTSFIVATLSIAISNILPHIISKKIYKEDKIKEKIYYKINPIYQNKNMYQINLNVTASLKISQIIVITIKLLKTEKQKNKKEIQKNKINTKKLNVRPV